MEGSQVRTYVPLDVLRSALEDGAGLSADAEQALVMLRQDLAQRDELVRACRIARRWLGAGAELTVLDRALDGEGAGLMKRERVRLIIEPKILREVFRGKTRPFFYRQVDGVEIIISIESDAWFEKYPEEP